MSGSFDNAMPRWMIETFPGTLFNSSFGSALSGVRTRLSQGARASRSSAAVFVASLVLAACSSGDEAARASAATLGSGEQTDGTGTADMTGNSSSAMTFSPVDSDADTETGGVDSDSGADTTGIGPTDSETGNVPPAACADDLAACDAWVLAPDTGVWNPITIGGPTPLAPTGEVLAAFDIEAPQLVYVLSATDVSVLDLETQSWITKLDFAATFPNIGDDPLLAAYSIPGHWGAKFEGDANIEGITMVSSTTVYIYRYDIEAETFTFGEASAFADSWFTPNAPPQGQLRAGWLDVTNAHDWATGSPEALCGAAATETGPHVPIIAANQVHIVDAGSCFEFYAPEAYATFVPTGLPGAPDVGIVGAGAYSETQGLWLFRGT
ncbi:MAG: hypothetical protein JKY37_09925 [Nannocystaceae bacterium]|nr:hypothetical protein [Nannocystaceae bacterium]